MLFATKEGEALVRKHCRAAGIRLADLRELVEIDQPPSSDPGEILVQHDAKGRG